jgi:hypothetical protein
MKLQQLRLNYLLLPALLFISFSSIANTLEIGPKETSTKSEWIKNDILGVWDYTAEDVPYEYSKGIIYITKEGKDFMVKVAIGESSIDGENVVIDKNEVRFQVYVEGQTVDINLSAKGNDLTGQGSTMDGIFSLSGKKRS